MASTPNNRKQKRSRPVLIPPNPPSQLLQLLQTKSWPAVLERILTHPYEVGSSPRFRNERGYTALHCLIAYNRSVAGEELARVADAMLCAAEIIDWGSECTLNGGVIEDGNTNEVNGAAYSNRPRKTGGAWRLLMDQNNQARWSPLHLVFVQGGVCDGKVSLARTLLMFGAEGDDEDEEKQNRRQVLQLVDRQRRTMLHHNCESLGPRDDNLSASLFLITQCPSMLFVRDGRGNTPLDYVLNRLTSAASTRSGLVTRRDSDEDCKRSYKMVKLLVFAMEREESQIQSASNIATNDRAAAVGIDQVTDRVDMNADLEQSHRPLDQRILSEHDRDEFAGVLTLNNRESGLAASMRNQLPDAQDIAINVNLAPRNLLHSICRLSREFCPRDSSYIKFLTSARAPRFEYGRRSTHALAADQDQHGNYALHILLSNQSYASTASDNQNTDEHVAEDVTTTLCLFVRELIAAYPPAVLVPNNDGVLPLRLAMKNGLRNVVALLVEEYPQAILKDSTLENMKVFTELLICISQFMEEKTMSGDSGAQSSSNSHEAAIKKRDHLLSVIFFLIRSRPDVVSLGGSASPNETLCNKQAQSPSWFKRVIGSWKTR